MHTTFASKDAKPDIMQTLAHYNSLLGWGHAMSVLAPLPYENDLHYIETCHFKGKSLLGIILQHNLVDCHSTYCIGPISLPDLILYSFCDK